MDGFLDLIQEMNPDALTIDGHDNAIVGIVYGFNRAPVLLYSDKVIIENLRNDMSYEEAQEFFEFNISGAYMGKGMPLFLAGGEDE